MPDDYFDSKLNSLKKIITPDKKASCKRSQLPSRYGRLAETLGGELITRSEGTYCLVRTVYESGTRLGRFIFEKPDYSSRLPLSAFNVEEAEGEAFREELLFFDIETTGLGGSGAVAFLIGCGSVVPGGFEVRQYLLPDFSDEAAMLESVLEELSHDKTVVSYNGVAFDMSMIRDRMIVNRVAREIKISGHIDLLHSVRRLFKRRLGDCSLGNVEQELFGFYRDDDIPGYLIPSVYFDWLGSEQLDDMTAVMEHNRRDIFSLYFLVDFIYRVFESEGASLDEVDDIYSLSRIYGRRKRHDKVLSLYSEMEKSASAELEDDILWFNSLAMKRSGQWSEAAQLWQRLAATVGREGYLANLELAKFFEHRQKDIEKALDHTRRAAGLCPDSPPQKNQLEKRYKRLSGKLKLIV
ncbi:MAG: ribonuclease H-like domain-containing protein [Candidatus Zixiibacteriota bacterium]